MASDKKGGKPRWTQTGKGRKTSWAHLIWGSPFEPAAVTFLVVAAVRPAVKSVTHFQPLSLNLPPHSAPPLQISSRPRPHIPAPFNWFHLQTRPLWGYGLVKGKFLGLTRVFGAHNGILEQRVEIFAQNDKYIRVVLITVQKSSGSFTKRCYITLCNAFSGKFLKILFVIRSCSLKYRENKQWEREKKKWQRQKEKERSVARLVLISLHCSPPFRNVRLPHKPAGDSGN